MLNNNKLILLVIFILLTVIISCTLIEYELIIFNDTKYLATFWRESKPFIKVDSNKVINKDIDYGLYNFKLCVYYNNKIIFFIKNLGKLLDEYSEYYNSIENVFTMKISTLTNKKFTLNNPPIVSRNDYKKRDINIIYYLKINNDTDSDILVNADPLYFIVKSNNIKEMGVLNIYSHPLFIKQNGNILIYIKNLTELKEEYPEFYNQKLNMFELKISKLTNIKNISKMKILFKNFNQKQEIYSYTLRIINDTLKPIEFWLASQPLLSVEPYKFNRIRVSSLHHVKVLLKYKNSTAMLTKNLRKLNKEYPQWCDDNSGTLKITLSKLINELNLVRNEE